MDSERIIKALNKIEELAVSIRKNIEQAEMKKLIVPEGLDGIKPVDHSPAHEIICPKISNHMLGENKL